MGKYLIKRILFSILSLLVVVGIVMILVYTAIHRDVVLQTDDLWNKKKENDRIYYEYTKYEDYGYLDIYDYGSFLKQKYTDLYASQGKSGEDFTKDPQYKEDQKAIEDEEKMAANATVQEFKAKYKNLDIIFLEKKSYQNGRQKPGGKAYFFAVDEKSVFSRMVDYFTHIISFETTNQVKDPNLTKDQRYIRFEKDPYSWAGVALVGSGTLHKYLVYFDNRFPFIHQNLMHVNLGKSYTTNRGIEIIDVVTTPTGNFVQSYQQYPKWIGTDKTELTAKDFHTARYKPTDLTPLEKEQFYDNYAVLDLKVSGLTPVGISFVMGIIAVVIAYTFGIMLGILQARHKDKLIDHLGNAYIVFVTAVPSLAYIFIVASIGTQVFKLPLKFATANGRWVAYIMPIISLSLGSIGGEMKWVRRYMIDQMNSDYVKFARAEGMSEREIYNIHIARNAMIYIVQGIPASVLFALGGALLTERVYAVPGVGGKMIDALSSHDNAVIVAMTLIFTTIAIVGEILGDLLLAKYDPRISLSSSSGGGRK